MNRTASLLALVVAVPVLLMVGAVMLLGFGSAKSDLQRPMTVPVTGRIIIDGVPADDAHIAFHPVDASIGWRPVARSDCDGAFRLMTFRPGDGAPPGDYVVTLLWIDKAQPYDDCGDMSPHDRLRRAYGDARSSPLRVTVAPGMPEVVLFASAPSGWTAPRIRDQVTQK